MRKTGLTDRQELILMNPLKLPTTCLTRPGDAAG